MIKVKVAKISAKTSNGNYLHTLKTEGTQHEVLGKTVTTGKRTYFLALTESAVLNSEHSIDLSQFSITEREMVNKDGEIVTGDNGNAIKLKWLNFK